MRKSIELAAAAAIALTLSVSAHAAGPAKELSGRAWIARVPAVPDDAFQASRLWVEKNGSPQIGPELEAFETDIAALAVPPDAEEGAPAAGVDRARAEQLAAEFDTPEGEERLKKMTPAEIQALGQSMMAAAPQGAGGGGLAPGDGPALKQISALTEVGNQTFPAMSAIQQEFGHLKAQWHDEEQALASKEAAAIGRLPVCRGEAGLPSDAAVLRVRLEYADQVIAVASRYLKKTAALQQKMRTTVTPHVDAADQARVAYRRLKSPAARQIAKPQVDSVGPLIANDAGQVYLLTKESAEKAAAAVVHKAALKKQSEGAKGC